MVVPGSASKEMVRSQLRLFREFPIRIFSNRYVAYPSLPCSVVRDVTRRQPRITQLSRTLSIGE
jgi:hypothetical protein